MIIKHKNLQNGYNIVCTLCKGNYKYYLYFKDELVYSFKDKYLPEDLPRLGKINRMINKIHNVQNIGTSDEIKKLKNEIYEYIIENLEINYKENELIFNKFHQTNGYVYNHKDTVIFYFMIKEVKRIKDDIYEIIILKDNDIYKYEDTIDNVLFDLIDMNLILTNYNNYKLVFNQLVNVVLTKGD